jgi:hypothetical protein
VADLDQGLDSHVASRSSGHQEGPDGLHVAVAGLGQSSGPAAEGRSGRLDGVGGIGLAGGSSGLTVGPVDLDDLDAGGIQVPGQPGAIGARALHADPGHLTEGTHPGQQLSIAGSAGRKRLDAQQAADIVQGRGDMDVQVGVDSARDGAAGFYDGHRHPFSLTWSRGGTHVPGRSDGVVRSARTGWPITPSERGVPRSLRVHGRHAPPRQPRRHRAAKSDREPEKRDRSGVLLNSGGPRKQALTNHHWHCWAVCQPRTAKSLQLPGTPLSSWSPRSSNSIRDPTTRGGTAPETRSSAGPA